MSRPELNDFSWALTSFGSTSSSNRRSRGRSSERQQCSTPSRNSSYRVLATSALVDNEAERQLLADYVRPAPWPYFKDFSFCVMRAVILQGSLATFEYNKHLDKQMQQDSDGKEVEEFDFEPWQKKHLEGLCAMSVKNLCIEAIRKVLEISSSYLMQIELFDKLTTQVHKAALRDIQRTGSRFKSFGNIVVTSLYGHTYLYLSSFIYDAIVAAVRYQRTANTTSNSSSSSSDCANNDAKNELAKKNFLSSPLSFKVNLTSSASWLVQKTYAYVSLNLFASLGMAIGVIAHPEYGGTVGFFVGELVASLLLGNDQLDIESLAVNLSDL